VTTLVENVECRAVLQLPGKDQTVDQESANSSDRICWGMVGKLFIVIFNRELPTHCCSLDERQRLSSSASRFWTNSLTAADSLTVVPQHV